MTDLYKFGEILTLINISIIFSIPIISLFFYKTFKDKVFLATLSIYFFEFINECILLNNFSIIYFIYCICTLKLVLIAILTKRRQLKKHYITIIATLGSIYILILSFSYEYSVILNIFMNMVILKVIVLDKIRILVVDLQENKKRLKQDKEYIRQSEEDVTLEYELQNEYKNEIFKISNKINKSMEESDTPIFILNINKEYIYSNKAFKMLIGKDDIDLNNLKILSYIQNKFSQGQQVIDIINKSNKEVSMNIKSIEGKTYRFICTTDIIDDKNVIICILNDITSTTIIQNKLKESEERYKKLMDILNEGVIIHNGESVSYINSKATEIFDLYDLEDHSISIENIKNKIIKKQKKEFYNNIALIKAGAEDRILTKLETEKGKIIEFVTTTLGLNNKDMFISIAIDITNLENAITDIEQSEKTYKLLLHTLPEGIIIIDKKTKRHIYRNESTIEILKSVGVEKFSEVVKTYLDNYEYGKFKKFTINSKNNIDISLAIIERKEDDTLVVVVRTLDYEYKAIKMKEELKEINKKTKFKTDFLYNIVNDIRKPIDGIFESNSILYDNKEKYESKSKYIDNYTRLLRQNCYRLIRISDNIKSIRDIESGNCSLKLEKCNVIKLINSIVKASKTYTDEKGIDIKLSSNIAEKIMLIDVEKVEKIILNILSNAIKFTDKGGKIELNINYDDEKLNISIKDTGIGIPSEKIDDIFDSFEQVDRTLSRGAEGTGIGLYLVKKLSELHDIEITVNSELDIGSEFNISINEKFESSSADKKDTLYSISENSEKVDVEYSDIYIDIS